MMVPHVAVACRAHVRSLVPLRKTDVTKGEGYLHSVLPFSWGRGWQCGPNVSLEACAERAYLLE